jgi:hypothetical protein
MYYLIIHKLNRGEEAIWAYQYETMEELLDSRLDRYCRVGLMAGAHELDREEIRRLLDAGQMICACDQDDGDYVAIGTTKEQALQALGTCFVESEFCEKEWS